jgi:hypothetical protein
MVSNIDCCQAHSTNYIRVNDYFSTLETSKHNGSLAICNQSWKSAVPIMPSRYAFCAMRFLFFSLFFLFSFHISAAWFVHFVVWRYVLFTSLGCVAGVSYWMCFLSFKSIHPSLCIQHILPLCLWHANGRRSKHATRFAFFHSIQSSICIHDILPICGMRTAEGRSMLMDVLFFVQIDPFIIM